jgi:ERCC4-type nuclease
MKIIIDEREASLYHLCQTFAETHQMKLVPIEKRVLQLGDIIFTSDDESVTHLVIERKSFSDLLASVKDGRYAEQSHRLIHCFPNPHNIVYLLEGMFSTVHQEKDKKKIISCMASLNYFKGFSLMRTVSASETAQHIVYLADKIAKELPLKKPQAIEVSQEPLAESETAPSAQPTNAPEPYCSVVKASKKANITKENIGEIILCQIPGISSTTAVELMKPFNTFAEFMNKIKEDSKYLDSVAIETNGKRRKIGNECLRNVKFRGYPVKRDMLSCVKVYNECLPNLRTIYKYFLVQRRGSKTAFGGRQLASFARLDRRHLGWAWAPLNPLGSLIYW